MRRQRDLGLSAALQMPELAWILAGFCIYLAAVPLARQTVFPEVSVALFWFPTAIFVGLVARLPIRCLAVLVPTIMLAEFIGTQVFEGVSLRTVWLWVLATTVEVTIVGLMLKFAKANRLLRPYDLLKFAIIVPLGVLVSAAIGGLAVSITFGTDWIAGFRGWWLGDVSGILILAPFILTIRPSKTVSIRRVLEYAALSLFTLGVALWIFSTPSSPADFTLRAALLVPMLGWIAMRFGVAAAAAIAPWVVLIAAIAAANSSGPFAGTSPNAALLVPTQAFLVLTCLTAYAAGTAADAQRSAQQRLYQQATHDELTGLANRRGMLERIAEPPPVWPRRGVPRALLFCDLRGFKQINDTQGHSAGDAALVETARRLRAAIGNQGSAARFGGDEFVVLLEGPDYRGDVEQLANRIVEEIGQPLDPGVLDLRLGIDIGIALEPSNARHSDDLVIQADLALLAAKAADAPSTIYYTDVLEERVRNRAETEELLRKAIENGWVQAWLQPIVSTQTGETIGAEALARIFTSDAEIHEPTDFIEVAEETGLIIDLGAVVLRGSLDWLAEQSQTRPDIQVSVNLSVRELCEANFADRVMAELSRRGIEPSRLILEVTERIMLVPQSPAVDTLESLKSRGVRIAIDDFGTGYSSLAALRQVPADIIKIDKSFVGGMGTSDFDDAIVAAIVHVAHDVGRSVVAEGVETADQARAIASLGAEAIQGFYYGHPAPAELFEFTTHPDMLESQD